MQALVVVHPEKRYFIDGDEEYNTELAAVFDAIAEEVEKAITAGKTVYLLGDQSTSPDSEHIYPAIREQTPSMTYFPGDFVERQFLQVKQQLMEDNIEHVILCGVQGPACVQNLYNLLEDRIPHSGRDCDTRDIIPMSDYDEVLSKHPWSDPETRDAIFSHRFSAVTIREDLTDKLLHKKGYS